MDPLAIFWVLTNSSYLVTKFIRTGIADKDDYPLFFEKAFYETEVDENEEINHPLLTVTARAHNESSPVQYKITSGNVGGAFGIHNSTGLVFITCALDYEKIKKYELRITASDNFKENYTTVVINIRDVNDNSPIFEKTSYRTQITEEDDRALPKRVLKVTANDADVDRPNNIIYFLTGPGINAENPSESNFDINKATGEIFVLKPLNRDPPSGRSNWRFTVFAQDEGGEGLVGFADVQINLKDVNDNAPVFSHGIYNGNVTENGTAGLFVMTMKADDYDDVNEGLNAKLIYSIEKNAIEEDTGLPIFEINPDTGVIKTSVCCLDREKTPDYSLQIVATDGGGLKGTGTASIRVTDLNDMPPHFTKDEWFVEVEETDGPVLPDAPILTVTVSDDDELNNFQYKIIESSGYGADKFAMVKNTDGTGSLKVVQPLDYEDPMQMNGFRFRIQVKDDERINDTDKNHIAHSWVIVKLKDINDNTPKFKKPFIEASAFESAEVGKVLGTFKAIDLDKGGKGRLTYLINRTSDRHRQFAINSDGIVTIQRPLDRETSARHDLEILAIDDGIPPRTATASLIVIVKDVNDNAPELAENYRPIVPENSPPRKIVELRAQDRDDALRGNGPPFQFRLDPAAADEIRSAFKVEQNQKGANGEGVAIVSSLKSFDREQMKEYLLPIVIKDSGSPSKTGTSTLTIIVGDVNDNMMHSGAKEITVYNYLGQAPDTPIGRAFVNDLDDWDLEDKKFFWNDVENHRFKIDEETGMVIMRRGAREGKYRLNFKVYDRKHIQESSANISVSVKHLPYEAIVHSGSMRVAGLTDEQLISNWDSKTQTMFRSKVDRLQDKLAELLNIDRKNIDIFSIQLRQLNPPTTDIRFSAHSQFFYKAVRLNGIVLLHKTEIETAIGLNITMVNINECMNENNNCNGSCSNRLDINTNPYVVNANKTAFVGIHINVSGKCECEAKNFNRIETCRTHPCLNGGKCVENKYGIRCLCQPNYSGPRCQQTTRSFRGNGWAWYESLDMCDQSHLSLEFVTLKADGLLLYNGPIIRPANNETDLSDFIAIELDKGYPRLLVDFGSGTTELKIRTKKLLNDGEWHQIDVFWDMENVRMVVDFCKSAEIQEADDGTSPEIDDASCQAQSKVVPFNEYLNVNTPLQVGGLYREKFDYVNPLWQFTPAGEYFDGCIRNIKHNGVYIDMAHPGLSKNAAANCPVIQDICYNVHPTNKCLDHGTCIGSMNEPKCECHPGWTGHTCSVQTVPTTFKAQSYVKYALSFEPNRYSTALQMRFRTRERYGEIFRMSDQQTREYGILDIFEAKLRFRYSLNSAQVEEQQIGLMSVHVDDGQWHFVKIQRYGSAVMMEIDGGEGKNYNETFTFQGHQWLAIDKQEGIYVGGKPEFTGIKSFEVNGDYQNSCIDDIRLDGKSLPLPPHTNGTQWGQAVTARNVERYCASNNPCTNAFCPEPFECVDLWNKYECSCGDGMVVSSEGKGCVDRNECLDMPCLNGGTCINQEPRLRYRCVCPENFWGENCMFMKERQALKLSTSALAAVIACLLIIIILLFLYFSFNRKRSTNVKKPVTKDDIRENIINYCDEGGGENDVMAFDMKTLKIPIGSQLPELVQHKGSSRPDIAVVSDQIIKVDTTVFDERKRRVVIEDTHAPQFDDLRNYAYEGVGSTAGSLSSVLDSSGTDDAPHEYRQYSSTSSPIGTTIFRNILAQDKDAGVNGLVEYFLVDSSKNLLHSNDTVSVADGHGVFAISYPHQGQVTVAKTLDYERIQRYYLTVVASDRARNSNERLSATTVITVNIADSDDLDPSFIYRGCVLVDGACINPEYTATVPTGTLQGVLNIHPERIQAVDLDQISAPIKYSFLSGSPSSFSVYFQIDEQTGIVKQTKLVDSSVTARQFDITVQAEEVSEAKRSTTARLTINVKPVDSFPPVIKASAIEGFVDENSAIGMKVLDVKGNPIRLTTTDADIPEDGELPSYAYELTTPSFRISKEGILLVNEENLDRDPPNPAKLRFQVVAREVKGNAASSPLSVTVNLNDINDNSPKLALIPPVTITAGDEKRLIAKANATDNDSGENAVITYSIHHVSNNGPKKFTIDKKTGEINTHGKLVAGERYSITVQASDIGNLYSQAIVEVTIIPGPNTKPPKFLKSTYEVQVSEGADINSTVTVVKAEDPESDPVHYVIVSGNDLRQFSIAPDTGVISVIRKLDREQITRYQLIVRADDNGGLSSSATVNIKVTDINDNNPTFDESMMPFKFTVEEGKANHSIGVVHAHDSDEGANANVTYSLPDEIPFKIDSKTGEIKTRVALDYETQKEYKFVVTAKDSAPDMRLGTATVTVAVKDVPDELPKFSKSLIEVKVPENVPDMKIVTVVAKDPDTTPEITYVFKNGPSDRFKIDAKTGVIKTVKGLDFEEEQTLEITVGTAENPGRGPGDIVKVRVIVEDRNDVPPVFVSIPEPVTVNDDQSIGSKIGSMPAVDGDGTAPGNTIRYEMVGRGKALKYFQVDPDTGTILLRDELKKEDDTEYQVDVRAYDLGEPQLSSVASLPVYVKHILSDPVNDPSDYKTDSAVIMNPESVGLAFSDDTYTTSVPETTGINATLKIIQIINSKKTAKSKVGFKCEIVSGNEWNLFATNIEDHSCGLMLLNSLDFENKSSYDVGIKLTSTKYLVNPQKSFCHVKIIVQDQNDNEPVFKFPKNNRGRNDTFYGVVNSDADIDTTVLQIKAHDLDSGAFGALKYRIYDEDEVNFISQEEAPSSYFTISEDSGVIKTQKPLQRLHKRPLKFIVEARDNNGSEAGIVNRSKARVVVNLISDINRMSLVFADSSPKEVKRHARALEELLLEKSPNLMIGIEKFSNRRSLVSNGSVIETPSATDVWFYALDLQTEMILERNSTEIVDKILEPSAQSQINLEASSIARATAQGIFAPIEAKHQIQKIKAAVFLDEEIFPFVLIFISAVILILGTSGIVYICISWSRYKNFKQQMRQYAAPRDPPRYDPVIINAQGNDASAAELKEYETQVLGMAVNEEQDDMQIDYSSKNHAFSLDNVSYITHKENGGQISPSNSDTSTVVIGTLQRNNRINLLNNMNNKQNTLNKTIELNRNNYANPLSIDTGFKAGTTLTLGRIKSERNQIINGYGDTLNRNNLTMAQNNTFSTLGRNRPNQHNNYVNHSSRNDLGLANNNNHNTLNRNHRYHADLPITNPIFKRHQSSEMLNVCASNENVYFGGNRGVIDYSHLGFPYNIDRSEQETTTEL